MGFLFYFLHLHACRGQCLDVDHSDPKLAGGGAESLEVLRVAWLGCMGLRMWRLHRTVLRGVAARGIYAKTAAAWRLRAIAGRQGCSHAMGHFGSARHGAELRKDASQ